MKEDGKDKEGKIWRAMNEGGGRTGRETRIRRKREKEKK